MRRSVAETMELTIAYTDPDAVLERYAELMALKQQRQGAAAISAQHVIQENLWTMEGKA